MTLQNLPDDSPLSCQVLPSVWAGYKKPACQPITEPIEQTSQAIQMVCHLPKEKADQWSNDFWLGSIHDFCVSYLGEDLTDEDHAKILLTANEFIKKQTAIRIDENEKDLIKLLAAKVVLNAHQWANHAMANACFLNEQGMIPKENVFMLQKGISPVFYEKDEFQRADSLKNKVRGVPDDRLLTSFSEWVNYNGMRYVPAFNQMGDLLRDMRYMNALILKKSIKSHLRKERVFRYRNRPRPRRHIWRVREE